ncbi:MAG TPA: hypothetical protein VFM65_06365 [Flavobacteriaceae bacterium]|nr:hypothetical protein [Flavobacteriaceae bacterium]
MKRFLYIFVLMFSAQPCLAQDTLVHISLKSYKQLYDEPLTKEDSLNFKFMGNDTLVLVKNYTRPKGVRVPYEPKDSIFLKYYKKVAFVQKGENPDSTETMKYWKDDIKLFFSKSVSGKTRREVMRFAETIDEHVDSLSISEVRNIEDSNYVVYFSDDYEYEPKLRRSYNSDYYIYWNGNSQIYRSAIKINTKQFFNEKMRGERIKEMFFLSLGRFVQIDDFACESYFANCYSKNKHLTPLDMELLKYHYSYGICKGTTREKFEKQHKMAKKILKNKHHKMMFIHSN